MMYLLKFAKSFAEGSPVPLGLPSPQTNKVDDKTLFFLETKHQVGKNSSPAFPLSAHPAKLSYGFALQVASLYMWLAQQFSVRMFPHLSEAEKVAAEIAKKLARGLMQVGGHDGGAEAVSKVEVVKGRERNEIVAPMPSRRMSMKEAVREFERIRISRENGVASAL